METTLTNSCFLFTDKSKFAKLWGSMEAILNREIEEVFVKTFVEKCKQERLFFELFHPDEEKRNHALHRFADYDKYLKLNLIHVADEKLSIDEVEQEIRKLYHSFNKCYIISSDNDGQTMPLRKALETIFFWGGAVIVVVDAEVAFLKGEQSFGPPMKLILHAKT